MGSLFLSSTLLAFTALLFTAAQSRTLASDCSLLKAAILATYGRSLSTPPPSPILPSPQSMEPRHNNGKPTLPSPPPPPIPAPSGHHHIISQCAEGVTPCNDNEYISMVTDFGKIQKSPPPPPKSSNPPHQKSHERSPPAQYFLSSTY